MINWIKSVAAAVIVISLALGALYIRHLISARDEQITALNEKLITSEKTVEVAKDRYAIITHEVDNLNDLLSKQKSANDDQINGLIDQIKKANANLLAANELVIKWKNAYEGAVNAHQGTEPSKDPGSPERKRVDFDKNFGYIAVTGYTLTDPAEGFVKVEQVRPLKLGIGVSKGPDGKWSTVVTSSEDGMAVDIALSAIDLSVTKPRWYQRLWVDAGVNFYGRPSIPIGVSYRLNRWSLGASCAMWNGEKSCGGTVGYRIFE